MGTTSLTNATSAAGMAVLPQPQPLSPQKPVFGNLAAAQAAAVTAELPAARPTLQGMANVQFAGTKLGKDGEFEVGLSPQRRKDILDNKMARILLDPPTSAYAQLSEGNKKALAHLVKAAYVLDSVWLQQDHPDNLAGKKAIEAAQAKAQEDLEAAQAAGDKKAAKAAEGKLAEANDLHTLFTSFNGIEGLDVYAPSAKPLALFKNRKQVNGKGVYPTDLTAKDLKAYVYAHPEDAAGIFSHNTIVIRDGDRLRGIPYGQYFYAEYRQAALNLLEAAQATDNGGLKNYLQWQAAALMNESDPETVYNADKAWVEMEDTPLEFTIGRESYDDRLASEALSDDKFVAFLSNLGVHPKKKDFIGVRVGIVNPESYGVIEGYRSKLKEFSPHMPGASEYKQSTDNGDGSNKMTFADVDLVALTGDYSAVRGGITVAQNLPNDDKLAVKLNCGSRLAFHRQVRQSGNPALRQKMLDALVDPEQHKWFDPESDFGFTVGHELGHSLGPASTDDGRDVIASLGDYGAMLEESKADLISIAMTDYFVKTGKFTQEEANKIYLTWTVGELPVSKPGLDQAHRVRSIMQLLYFIKHGAVKFEAGSKLSIVPEKMGEVGWKMLTDVVNLQRAGNPDKALAFVKEYFDWTPALEYARQQKLGLKPKMYRVVDQPLAQVLLKQVEG